MSRSRDVHNTLPDSPDAEKAVLSCLIQFPAKSIDLFQEMVSVDMLHNPGHRTLCEAILGLWNSSGAVDPILLLGRLQEARTLDSVGGPSYISQVQFLLPSAANLRQYLEIIRSCYHKRELIRAAGKLEEAAYNGEEDIAGGIKATEEAIERWKGVITGTADGLSNKGWRSVVDDIERSDTLFREGKIQGIATGLRTYDRTTGGLQKGTLIGVGATPNVGKTLLVSQFALATVDHGLKVAVFSLEMSEEKFLKRMLPQVKSVTSGELKSGCFKEASLTKMASAMQALEKKIFINDNARLTVAKMIQILKHHFSVHPDTGLIVIDYLQLIQPSVMMRKIGNREQQVSEIIHDINAMKKIFDVPVVIVTALNRKHTDRKDGRPKLSDSRDSGAIEYDLDVGILLHFPEVEDTQKKGTIIIDKQRDGETRDIEAVFNKQWLRFEEA